MSKPSIIEQKAAAELRARLEDAADMIADAIANHESGGKCDLDLARASVWLANYENVVERQKPK
jgi:hypothetical protein